MRRFAVFVLMLFLTVKVHAGILVEPYLGYSFGTGRPKGIPSSHHTGTTFGARLGYQMLGAMGGLEYQTGRWTNSATPSDELTPSYLGIFVGYNLPILLRAYVSYMPFANLTAQRAGFDHTYDGGDVVKYGVGWTGLPFVSVNFEYSVAQLRAIDLETYQISVSLPVNF